LRYKSGRCIKAGWDNGGYGFCVVIVDAANRYWIYAHLSKVLVNADTNINIGDTIGIEGNSGNSFGSHLHLEVRQNGWNRGNVSLNVASILGIPNVRGIVSNTANTPTPVQNLTSNPSTGFTFSYNVREDVKELQKI
jgi:Membrane proteins related to metalloendopeptidases